MKRDWNTRTALILIGLILVAVNLIGLQLFGRLDLTDDRVYSLSEASIEAVESLADPITITAFFTDNLPAPYSDNRRFLQDKLDDYRAYGGANVQYTFVDPVDDEELQQEAARYRIPPVQIQVYEQDNVQFKNAYMGVALLYGSKREIIPVFEDRATLEFDLTSAIRRLTQDAMPSVGFLTGHGEPAPAATMQQLYQQLNRNYERKSITIVDSTASLSERPDALVIVAPTDSFPESHLRALDSYVMDGGRLALLLNRIETNMQAGQAFELTTGIEGLLANYGVGLKGNLVMDEQNAPISIQRPMGTFMATQQIPYPFLPVVTNFNGNSMMVNRLGSTLLFFASTVDTSLALPPGATREILASSTTRSQLQEGFFMIQPGFPPEMNFSDGPFPLAAAYTGSFPSAYEAGRQSAPTRIVLVGDGDFINESIVGALPGNINFGLNMTDWLVQDDALLAIRAKSAEPRVLRETSESARGWIKYGNMLAPLLLLFGIGLYRWQKRRSRQIVLTS
ncbi:MAG: GldG family protein [Rhodothermales bacterium]|nr:GldG family protein [Rhodothermales bacterium]